MSDSDRQHDTWLPGDHSNFTPVAENLSTPGLIVRGVFTVMSVLVSGISVK
jgi:hypothetical protein